MTSPTEPHGIVWANLITSGAGSPAAQAHGAWTGVEPGFLAVAAIVIGVLSVGLALFMRYLHSRLGWGAPVMAFAAIVVGLLCLIGSA
jgi:hypothetical protein